MLTYLHVVLIATQPTFENKHHCLRAKSGFNSVSNPHMLKLFEKVRKIHQLWDVAEFDPSWR